MARSWQHRRKYENAQIDREFSYDEKCYELAEAFVDDSPILKGLPLRKKYLAQRIQEAIESWLDWAEQGGGTAAAFKGEPIPPERLKE